VATALPGGREYRRPLLGGVNGPMGRETTALPSRGKAEECISGVSGYHLLKLGASTHEI